MVDIIAKLGLQKGSVIRHMTAIVQPILEKGIVDHTITHKLLIEYMTVADKVFFKLCAEYKFVLLSNLY